MWAMVQKCAKTVTVFWPTLERMTFYVEITLIRAYSRSYTAGCCGRAVPWRWPSQSLLSDPGTSRWSPMRAGWATGLHRATAGLWDSGEESYAGAPAAGAAWRRWTPSDQNWTSFPEAKGCVRRQTRPKTKTSVRESHGKQTCVLI